MTDEHLISLQPGTVIAGRYEIVKCLGAGSMGLVYACRHRELSGHLVAAKVLFPEVAQDKVAAQRFQNEIFASYGVSHPNVVRAYEYIRDGDLVAYTMEYVGGGDLADRLGKSNNSLTITEIARILSQMCSGVQAIHDAGIVHRDLKPENILLTKEGDVKIADFGIARTERGPKLTEHGGVVGTIDYVSPEYMLNSQVDWRSDIYAIGILGYEMITGESPFRADSVYATMTKRLKTDAPPPSTKRPECPPELDAIILKAMLRNPEERYQSSAEMFYDLKKILAEGQAATNFLAQPTLPQGEKSKPRVSIEESNDDLGEKKRSTTVQEGTNKKMPMSRGMSPQTESASSRAPTQQLSAISPPKARPQKVENKLMQGFGNEPAVEKPVKMESVLAYKDIAASNWKKSESVSGVNIAVHEKAKLSRLSDLVNSKKKGILLDFLTFFVAIVFGVGVAVLIVNSYFPKEKGVENVDLNGNLTASENDL